MSARIAITGGGGFIGRHVVAEVKARGHEPVLLIRPDSNPPDFPDHCRQAYDQTEKRILDTYDGEALTKLFNPAPAALIHLAAAGVRPDERDPELLVRVNADWPPRIAVVCARAGVPMVLAGSASEYAPKPERGPYRVTNRLESERLYGATKAAGGLSAQAVNHSLGGRLALARIFGVFGPGEAPHRLLPSLVAHLAENRRIPLSEGRQIRDLLYGGDAAEALVTLALSLAADTEPLTTAVNICRGEGMPIREFCRIVCDRIGAPENLLGFGDIGMRPDEIEEVIGDPEPLAALCGWRAGMSVEDGLDLSLKSYGVTP